MYKTHIQMPLRLTGDRVLFIIVTWIFSVTLSVFLHFFIKNGADVGLIYSVLTALPYVALIYYEVYDFGSRDSGKGIASMRRAVTNCLLWQIPSLIFFLLYLISFISPISTRLIDGLFAGIWLAPFIGPRGASETETVNLIQYLVFMGLEWFMFLISYYLGMKDIVLIKTKPKKSAGTMKK